jgi:hypothetical protein
MTSIRVIGQVTEEGELQFTLPEDIPAGEVEIIIRWQETETSEDVPPPFTDEELAELLKPEPPTPGHLIETGVWQDSGIEDSVEWVQQQRELRARKFKSNG